MANKKSIKVIKKLIVNKSSSDRDLILNLQFPRKNSFAPYYHNITPNQIIPCDSVPIKGQDDKDKDEKTNKKKKRKKSSNYIRVTRRKGGRYV